MSLPAYLWPTLGATILLVALLYFVHRCHCFLERKLEAWRRLRKEGLAAQAAKVISIDKIADRLRFALGLFRWAVMILLLVRFVSYELGQFPETRPAGEWIVNVVLMPFKDIYDAFVAYIPKAFQMLAVVLVTRYLLILVHKVFLGIQNGALKIEGFYPEWAEPTYKLVRFAIFVLALVAIFPYLPGSSSPAFQTISVFLGVVFSLGSSSLVANTVSGTILTYMRALRVGDRVKIQDSYGDVIERTLLVTRIRTVQNEVVTIPNSVLLNGQIINYSTMAEEGRLILRSSVTIGYDAPWPKVHEALLEAARRTPLALADPAPFVLQTALNDYNVAYVLNIHVRDASRTQFILSDLNQRIQDTFAEADIEILSPMYNTIRQSQAGDTIPKLTN